VNAQPPINDLQPGLHSPSVQRQRTSRTSPLAAASNRRHLHTNVGPWLASPANVYEIKWELQGNQEDKISINVSPP
jgi:TFIIF-interacting CTD phosphatase-like protein